MTFKSIAGVAFIVAAWANCVPAVAETAPSPEVRAANHLLDLFSEACMKSLGRPEGVRAWAVEHHLTAVDNPAAMYVYAGGDGGAIWMLNTSAGPFVLALRAQTQACAVFGDNTDPQVVESYIVSLMQVLKRPGRPVSVMADDLKQTDFGSRHGLVYAVGGGAWPTLQVYTVITNERPGGPYQATVQVVAKAKAQRSEAPTLP